MKTLLSLLTLPAIYTVVAAQSPAVADDVHPHLQILESSNPAMPLRLKTVGINDGECRVLISVDSTGKLADYLVLAYTKPELADACISALKSWKFAPPIFRGEPVSLQRELTFDFDSKGSVLTFDLASYVGFMTTRVLGGLKMEFRPRTLKEVDHIPTPIHTARPIAPKGASGSATVEFYIDPQGAVRMPSLVEADSPELGDAAASAVRQWHFDPPMYQGQPALVRVQQTFKFQP